LKASIVWPFSVAIDRAGGVTVLTCLSYSSLGDAEQLQAKQELCLKTKSPRFSEKRYSNWTAQLTIR
jgi:hypothetical protein